MVIPERVVLEKIHLLPPALRGDRGGPRRRRALPRQRAAAAEALLLRLPAAGAELYLHLRRDLRFLARGFEVEQRRGEARRTPSPRRPPEERLCFYTGHVLNRSDSFASLSTCAGLVLPPRPASPQRGPLPRPSPRAAASFSAAPARLFLSAAAPLPARPTPTPAPLRSLPGGGGKRPLGRAHTSPQRRAPPARCPACPLASPGPGDPLRCPP